MARLNALLPAAASMIALAMLHGSAEAASRRLAPVAAPKEAATPKPMTFAGACTNGDRVLIAGVGDLLFHESLQRQALAPSSSYRRFFAGVEHILKGADITYGNLEGPAAEGVAAGGGAVKDPGRHLDGRVYGTVPGALIFNYHPSAAADLKAVGFSVVSTANNHGADRGALGIDRTIDALEAAGLAYTGTRRRTGLAGALAGDWTTMTTAKGFRVAWIACTYGTNGMPDRHNQVLQCYRDREAVMGEIAQAAADPTVDAVILTPHWGLEGTPTPLKSDRDYARAAVEAGATAVIGAHPHVLQPWEKIATAAGRDGLVIYSTGNFVSNQTSAAQRSGVIALLELVKPAAGGKARMSAAGFVPTWLDKTNGHRVMEMAAQSGEIGSALKGTLKLLPAANRVSSKSIRQLPKADCGQSPSTEEPQVAAMPALPSLHWPPTPPAIDVLPTKTDAAASLAAMAPDLNLPVAAPAITATMPQIATPRADALITTALPSMPPLDIAADEPQVISLMLPARPFDEPSLPRRSPERVLRARAVSERRERHHDALSLDGLQGSTAAPPPMNTSNPGPPQNSPPLAPPIAGKKANRPSRKRKATAAKSKARIATSKARKHSPKH